MKWTVTSKVVAGYGLALFILVCLGFFAYQTTAGLIHAADRSVHTYRVLDDLAKLLSSLQDAETGQRGYLLTGDEAYLQPYTHAKPAIGRYLGDIRQLTSDNPDQQRRLDSLNPLISAKEAELDNTINLRKNQGLDAALQVVRTNKGKRIMDDIRKIVARMADEEKDLLSRRNTAMKTRSMATIDMIIYGIPLAVVVVGLFGFMVTRTITRQLRESISLLASSSSEILATTTQVASGATETAAAVSQTTATVEEVKQTAQVATQKAKYVSESAQEAAQVSQKGRKAVEETVGGMQRVQGQMESVAESIVGLSEQSQSIGEIIATVNDLADQSNLLAVNAAIEATKAGDQGKGFAVVAQEVRSLAEQSKQATAKVRAILGEIQKATSAAVLATEQGSKAVDAGMKQSEDAGESIRQLSESILEASQAASQIAASSQQQMAGMDQVAQAMENIKQASSQNVAGTKQAEVAAHDLHELGLRLKRLVG